MNREKPSLQTFKEKLTEIFRQELNQKAIEAATDFWNYWNDFLDNLLNNSIHVDVDMLFLSKRFPEYGRYNIWKGFSIVVIIIGIILFVYSWKFALPTLVIGISISSYGKILKSKDGKRFIEEIKTEIRNNEITGMAKICSHYIAGTIQFSSNNGNAHWPSYPSAVLTGETKFIE